MCTQHNQVCGISVSRTKTSETLRYIEAQLQEELAQKAKVEEEIQARKFTYFVEQLGLDPVVAAEKAGMNIPMDAARVDGIQTGIVSQISKASSSSS